MKRSFLIALICFLNLTGSIAQKKLTNVSVKSLDGKEILSSEFDNQGKPIILSFWATWCKPCLSELTAFNDEFEDWQEETGVKLIAVSIDDARTNARVKSLVNGKDWPFEVYLDPNQNLKRALNIVNIPYTLVLNGKGEIVWKHTSYNPGSEEEVIQVVRELVSKNK
jgi:thiol-disulfide isomerase/thioredoxin